MVNHQQWCMDNDIIICPKPLPNDFTKFIIVIYDHGRAIEGKEIFGKKETYKEIELFVFGKLRTVLDPVPALKDKIDELYLELYKRNKDRL